MAHGEKKKKKQEFHRDPTQKLNQTQIISTIEIHTWRSKKSSMWI